MHRLERPRTETAAGRDLRLDFFRGLALVFIFLDHMPSNTFSWFTIHNFGFSDAAEMFVFISGYSAMLAYGGRLESDGYALTVARILKRCWQIYAAQMILCLVFTGQVAYTAVRFDNPAYSHEMNIVPFLGAPHVALMESLLLRFRPNYMDILPLYVVLLGAFPLALPLIARHRRLALAGSAGLYAAANLWGWNLGAWPDGVWYFNPLCWQLLFVIGAILAADHGPRLAWLRAGETRALLLPPATAYLGFALLVALSWQFPSLAGLLPGDLAARFQHLDKTGLDPFRLAHFLALAYVVVLAVPADHPLLSWRVSLPLIRCGQHSLEVFCLSVVLSFTGYVVLSQVGKGFAVQLAVSAGGIVLMSLTAFYLGWYRRAQRASDRPRDPVGRNSAAPSAFR